jgi:homocysteine S-methyltransferase
MDLLVKSGADIIACETIPSIQEGRILGRLILKYPDHFFWVSFSCRDSEALSDGSPIIEAVREFEEIPQILAVGVNCTAPRYISGLVDQIRSVITEKDLIIYPNAGESFNADKKEWTGTSEIGEFIQLAGDWYKSGARIIGGCCRTGPDHIRHLRSHLNQIVKGVIR